MPIVKIKTGTVMKQLPLFFVVLLLQGCDAAKEIGAQVTKMLPDHEQLPLVFKPGYKMQVNGMSAPVFGKDECPSLTRWFPGLNFSPDADEGRRLCIVVGPETKTVPVTVVLPEGPIEEVWTVERSGDRTLLRRPDGSYLAEGNQSSEAATRVSISPPNCITTGSDSPIVVANNSTVIVNGKTYEPGQNADCVPSQNNMSTHGVGSPIVTGKGATVIIHTE